MVGSAVENRRRGGQCLYRRQNLQRHQPCRDLGRVPVLRPCHGCVLARGYCERHDQEGKLSLYFAGFFLVTYVDSHKKMQYRQAFDVFLAILFFVHIPVFILGIIFSVRITILGVSFGLWAVEWVVILFTGMIAVLRLRKERRENTISVV